MRAAGDIVPVWVHAYLTRLPHTRSYQPGCPFQSQQPGCPIQSWRPPYRYPVVAFLCLRVSSMPESTLAYITPVPGVSTLLPSRPFSCSSWGSSRGVLSTVALDLALSAPCMVSSVNQHHLYHLSMQASSDALVVRNAWMKRDGVGVASISLILVCSISSCSWHRDGSDCKDHTHYKEVGVSACNLPLPCSELFSPWIIPAMNADPCKESVAHEGMHSK